jgi:transcriptional regulator GlxA family with amidase domain
MLPAAIIGGMAPRTELTVAVAIWDGVEELDAVGPYEVLGAWAAMSDRSIRVLTVGQERRAVSGSHGLVLVPDLTWEELGRPHVLVLPGGASSLQVADEALLDRMRGFAKGGTLMTSVCTGALVYAAAGILDDKPATTHWSALTSLGRYGQGIELRPEARFVDAGDVITAAGVSAGIDMALYLVARLESEERAREVCRYIQYDPEPPI